MCTLWVSKRAPVRYVLVWTDVDPTRAFRMNPKTGVATLTYRSVIREQYRPTTDYSAAYAYANGERRRV